MKFKQGIEFAVAAVLAIGVALGISAAGTAEVAPQFVVAVYFKSHSDAIGQESKAELDLAMSQLRQAATIKVVGYVQQRGSDVAPFNNSRLSYRRADMVAKYIQKALGDPIKGQIRTAKKPTSERLYVVYGAGQPDEGFNLPTARRVEVWISVDAATS